LKQLVGCVGVTYKTRIDNQSGFLLNQFLTHAHTNVRMHSAVNTEKEARRPAEAFLALV